MIQINEVITRDGLQIEKHFVPTDEKVQLIDALSQCGYAKIEVSSFVSPKAVPHLKDAKDVFQSITKNPELDYVALVPNLIGAKHAVAAEVDEINLVMSASATHNKKNVNKTHTESLAGFKEILSFLKAHPRKVNGSIATSFGCPFEGDIKERDVFNFVEKYLELGMHSITLADTTGMANPRQVNNVVKNYMKHFREVPLTLHFHNTRGMGLANLLAAIEAGATQFDASLGGIGGCPFAPGATGNISTEDTVHMLHEMGMDTQVDLDKIIAIAKTLPRILQRESVPGQIVKSGKTSDLHPV